MALIHKEGKLVTIKNLVFITLLVLGLSFLYLANPMFGDYSGILTTILYVSATGYLCYITTRVLINSKKYDQKIFVPILMFTISAFFIFAAEQTWTFYVEILDEDPFPSIADIFYLATYPFLGFFLISRVRSHGLTISKKVIFFVFAVSSTILIPTMLAAYDWNYDEESWIFLTAMSYPLFDGVLFGIAMIGLLYFYSKKYITMYWSLIFAGILLWVVADTAWLFMEIEDLYYDGHPIDITWLVSYVLFGYAFTLKNKEITSKSYNSQQNESNIQILNLGAIMKIAIPFSIVTIVFVATFFMIDYGLFGFNIDEHLHDINELRFLIVGLLITFSLIIILLLRNTKGLIKIRENELEVEQKEIISSERLATIGELGARLAHDLRNPLSLIKNNMLVIKKTSDDPKFNGRIEVQRINDAISRMSHQIENVLDFVKNRELTLEDVNLNAIIKSVIGDNSKNIKCEFPQQDVIIKCDSLLLEIVFVNLLSNAKDAIGESGNIFIRIIDKKNDVIIEIEDSGPGITEDELPKIFDPLFTTKQQGTGLGLASCKNIIEKHGGTISVKNNPTIFTVSLPKSHQ